jgi:pyridine nucleotide-disulfide oxidoreductase family protein
MAGSATSVKSAYRPRQLVLLGAGHAHVHLLSSLAKKPMADVQLTLVAPYQRQLYSGMVPGFVAGHYALEDCVIALEPLLKNTSTQWLTQSVVALDANARRISLDDGSEFGYDYLSVNTGPVQDRSLIEAAIPGAREHGLFLRPIEIFGALWPRVTELAQSRNLRIAVIGAGAAGIELAMAIRHRLPGCSVTLITGGESAAANYPVAVQQRVAKALTKRSITVLPELAVGIGFGEVLLQSGARLVCEVPVIAIGAQAPPWLTGSGLALDASGFIAVNACQQSSSHASVFACGDVSSRIDRSVARNGVYAVRVGPALVKNLAAVLSDALPSPYVPQTNALNLLSCGDRYAIASWGRYSAQGRWVWWLKDWIDRAFIRRYRRN